MQTSEGEGAWKGKGRGGAGEGEECIRTEIINKLLRVNSHFVLISKYSPHTDLKLNRLFLTESFRFTAVNTRERSVKKIFIPKDSVHERHVSAHVTTLQLLNTI